MTQLERGRGAAPHGPKVSAMLITLLAVQSLWMVFQEHQDRRQIRNNSRSFAGAGMPGGAVDPNAPFWPAVLARCRKQIKLADARRDRTRRALERLSRLPRKPRGARRS